MSMVRSTLALAMTGALLAAGPTLAQTGGAGSTNVAPVQLASNDSDVAGAAAADDDQRVRCRRIPITGSLVRVERVCKTVAEWRRLSERGNDVVRQQWENGLVCSGGECRGN